MSEIDKTNRILLRELSVDGRLSNVELAKKVGLSPSACLRRVQELESQGIILGYRAVLNPEKLGRSFLAYVTVGLSDHSIASQRSFEESMESADEVSECHNITGTFEYLLRVEASDLAGYKQFHAQVLAALPQVTSITTYVVIESPKNQRG